MSFCSFLNVEKIKLEKLNNHIGSTNIVDQYYDDILADNALFEIARIYQFDLEDPLKAKEMYEKLNLVSRVW